MPTAPAKLALRKSERGMFREMQQRDVTKRERLR
jgi:hypothetical protein